MNRDFSDMATLPKRIQPIALVGRGRHAGRYADLSE